MVDMIENLNGEYRQVAIDPDAVNELDLGCGKGGFLLDLAARYPERMIYGLDVMIPRLRKIRNKCRTRKLENVHLWRANAWAMVGVHLPDHCLDRVHVLCPDPWPKARHRGHRLLSAEFISRLASKIKPGGILHLGTDNDPYWELMCSNIAEVKSCEPCEEGISDVRDIKTDFERGFEALGLSVHHRAWRVNH